jgi:hypothetical protein
MPVRITGQVLFASRIPKIRAVIMPNRCTCELTKGADCRDGGHRHKRVIATFAEPQKLSKGEVVTILGQYRSEGWESIVIADAVLMPRASEREHTKDADTRMATVP